MREEQFRTLAENLPDVIIRYDRDCRRVYVNRAHFEATGLSGQDVLGKTPVEWWGLPGVSPADYQAKLSRVMESGEPAEIELEWSGPDGRRIHHAVHAVPEYDPHGMTVGVLTIGRDVTRQRRAEEALATREREFRTLAESSPDHIARYDRHCRLLYANPQLRKALNWGLGRPLEEMLGLSPMSRAGMARENWMPIKEYQAVLERVIDTGEAGEYEFSASQPSGKTKVYLLRTVAERNPQGEIIGVLAVGRDITALKETERRLEESRVQLRKLAAHREAARENERKHIAREVHDELGQRLTALRMSVSLLRIQFGALDPGLLENIQNILRLVDDAILVTRDVATALRPAALDLGIASALEWLLDQFMVNTGIDAELSTGKDSIVLEEERAIGMFRIAQESLTNIARHAGASRVRITLEKRKTRYVLEIRDDGRGFDPAIPKPKALGLLGMRERALVMNAELTLSSSPGNGTAIVLSLPVDRAPMGQ